MVVSSPSLTTAPVPDVDTVSAHGRAGVDGIRALAVAAVVTMQLRTGAGTGGSRGVDLLFVATGFTLTTALVHSRFAGGQVHLAALARGWSRRRLPDALVVVWASAVAVIVWRHDQLTSSVGAMYSTFAGAANWWLVGALPWIPGQSSRPSLLEHLWAPSVEFQFAVGWSCAVLVVLGGVRARSRPATARLALLAGVAVVLATASALAALSLSGHSPPARVAFGSDTRSAPLFLGAAVAAGRLGVLERRRLRRSPGSDRRRVTGAVADGVGAALLLGVVVVSLTGVWSHPASDHGGAMVFAAASATALVGVVRPEGRLGRILDTRPLHWVGQRWYALYLWSWPVTVVTRPGVDVGGPPWLLAVLRVAVIVGLADLTHRLVDLPLRRGIGDVPDPRRSTHRPSSITVVALGTAVATTLLVVGASIHAGPPSQLAP